MTSDRNFAVEHRGQAPPIVLNHAKRRFRIHSETRGQIVAVAEDIGLVSGYKRRGGVDDNDCVDWVSCDI